MSLYVLYGVFGYCLAMPQLQHILIAVLALYCCFMVFKVSANAGFFLLPLLLVLSPLVFKGRKKGIWRRTMKYLSLLTLLVFAAPFGWGDFVRK